MAQSLDERLSKVHGTSEQRTEFFESYIGANVYQRKILNGTMAHDDFIDLVRHAYQTIWKLKYGSPELVSFLDMRSPIGSYAYVAMGVNINSPSELLRKCIEGYGIFDDEKMRTFIEKKDISSRQTLSKAFFEGPNKQDNARKLVNYTYQTIWKQKYGIPELVSVRDIENTMGRSAYNILGVKKGHASELLRKCIDGYGIFDDEKMKVFIEKSDADSRRKLSKAFFEGPNKQDNARKLVNYTYQTIWKQKYGIPELVGARDIENTMGMSAYNILGVKKGHASELLRKCIDGYGVLDNEKAIVLEKIYFHNMHTLDTRSNIFFGKENRLRTENARQYLEAFLQNRGKRLSDLVESDLRLLPREVADLMGDKINPAYVANLPKYRQQPKVDVEDRLYRVAQIRWNRQLETVLREILPDSGIVEFIRENAQLLWEKLGITSFGAHMKAQELGLIPTTIVFNPNGEKSRFPTYPLIEFDGYQFRKYALRTANQSPASLDTHLFTSPVHRQNLHANLPLEYKGILKGDYTKEQWELISTVAAYLFNPNMFAREVMDHSAPRKLYPSGKSVFRLNAPASFEVYPKILPVMAGENMLLAQVFLPAKESKDTLSIIDSVIRTRDQRQVYVFKHDGARGRIAV